MYTIICVHIINTICDGDYIVWWSGEGLIEEFTQCICCSIWPQAKGYFNDSTSNPFLRTNSLQYKDDMVNRIYRRSSIIILNLSKFIYACALEQQHGIWPDVRRICMVVAKYSSWATATQMLQSSRCSFPNNFRWNLIFLYEYVRVY